MIGRSMKRSRARQCGMRLSIGMSTALQTRKMYSMVKIATEMALKLSRPVPCEAAMLGTVSAAKAMAFKRINAIMNELTK